MNKVALTLESKVTSADDLEELLEALKPILALTTTAEAHIVILEEA